MFSLNTHKEENITTLEKWIQLFADKNNKIIDEYDTVISIAKMIDIIMNRKGISEVSTIGYKDLKDFHSINCSEPGPNNLLRHKVDGKFCIKHGSGTWDYMTGEFF